MPVRDPRTILWSNLVRTAGGPVLLFRTGREKGVSAAAARVARHAAREALADQVSFVASGVAFRVGLAMFPAVALVVWLGSRLLGTDEVRSFLLDAMQAVPDSTREIVRQAVSASMAKNPADRGGALLGSAAPLLGLAF
ncbi:hypothetical protein D8770_26655, partial [Methylobacterium sp. DB1607]|nr:hypothetical protein [Methylobacterium sp. DB1607]